jgi:hypothetical protein
MLAGRLARRASGTEFAEAVTWSGGAENPI